MSTVTAATTAGLATHRTHLDMAPLQCSARATGCAAGRRGRGIGDDAQDVIGQPPLEQLEDESPKLLRKPLHKLPRALVSS